MKKQKWGGVVAPLNKFSALAPLVSLFFKNITSINNIQHSFNCKILFKGAEYGNNSKSTRGSDKFK